MTGKDKFGFRKLKGTRNATGMLRIISELWQSKNCIVALTGRRHLISSLKLNLQPVVRTESESLFRLSWRGQYCRHNKSNALNIQILKAPDIV